MLHAGSDSAREACSTSSSMISAIDCSDVTIPTLWPAISEPLFTSPSMTARLSVPAQKRSISQLCADVIEFTAIVALDDLALLVEEASGTLVHDRTDRNDRKPGIELHGRLGIPGTGTKEGVLEVPVGTDSRAQTKRVPSWTPAAPILR